MQHTHYAHISWILMRVSCFTYTTQIATNFMSAVVRSGSNTSWVNSLFQYIRRSWFNKDLFTINNHCETQNVNALNCFQKLIVMYYVTIMHSVNFMVFPWTHKHTPLWWSTARTLCSMIRIVTTWVACLFPYGKRITDWLVLWQDANWNWREANWTKKKATTSYNSWWLRHFTRSRVVQSLHQCYTYYLQENSTVKIRP